MKILQISPQFPFPETDGGKIGIASTYRQLAQKADVTLFCFTQNHINEEDKIEALKYGKIVIFKYNTKNSIFRIVKSIFKKDPLFIFKYSNQKVFELLDELMIKEKYDVIHADHTSMAQYAVYLKNKYNVHAGLRLHNVEHLIWERYANIISYFNPKKLYINSQAQKLKKYEADILNKVSVSFPITNKDCEIAKSISLNAEIVVAGPGINIEKMKPEVTDRNTFSIIHATTYDWVHNVDAIRWFITDVMTDLHKIDNRINLILLGKNPPDDFSSYSHIGVNVKGYVESIIPFLSSASIYVAPLFVGGGIRIKILEAMAMELPVIASPISAEGINASINDGLIIANSKEEFVKNILNLINNPTYSRELGKKAREFVMNNYTWDKSIGIIYQKYKQYLLNQ
jgi:glycosyltransferase involved in cell wall biosynthesis